MNADADTHKQQQAARVAGVFYLLIIAAGIFAEVFVRSPLIVSGDPAATAQNILGSLQWFRVGILSDIVMLAADVVVALALYAVLRPYDRDIALLSTLLRIVMVAILGLNLINLVTALHYLTDTTLFAVMRPAERYTLALLSLEKHAIGYDIGLLFFGLAIIALGHLLFYSRYVPRVLGAAMSIAGGVYIVGSCVRIVAPAMANWLQPAYAIPLLAELSLALWLTFRGVNVGTRRD